MAGKKKSGKGKKCSACGEAKFQKYGQIYKCSGCGQRGWSSKAIPQLGGGPGAMCNICKKKTLHRIFNRKHLNQRLIVQTCRGCETVLFKRTVV